MNTSTPSSVPWFLLPIASVAVVAAGVSLTLAVAMPSEALRAAAPEIVRAELSQVDASDRPDTASVDDARLPPGHPPVPGLVGKGQSSRDGSCPFSADNRSGDACPHARPHARPSCPGLKAMEREASAHRGRILL